MEEEGPPAEELIRSIDLLNARETEHDPTAMRPRTVLQPPPPLTEWNELVSAAQASMAHNKGQAIDSLVQIVLISAWCFVELPSDSIEVVTRVNKKEVMMLQIAVMIRNALPPPYIIVYCRRKGKK